MKAEMKKIFFSLLLCSIILSAPPERESFCTKVERLPVRLTVFCAALCQISILRPYSVLENIEYAKDQAARVGFGPVDPREHPEYARYCDYLDRNTER